MLRSISLLACTGALLAACSIQIPDATYVCGPTEACPNGFVCSEGLCRREGVDAGPLGDGGVDGGDQDGGNCVPEVCNGSDDDCDGIVDDGVLQVFDSEDIQSTAGTFWSRFLRVPDGGFVVLSGIPDNEASDTAIVASRYDAAGNVVVASLELVRAGNNHFEAATSESHIYVVRTDDATDNLMLDQFAISTLARVGTPFLLSTQHASDFYDVATETTGTGDRAAVLYRGENDITHIQTVNIPALTPQSLQNVHTPDVEDPPFEMGTLAPAPCGSGFYAQLVRFVASPGMRIYAVDEAGFPLAEGYDITLTAPNILAFARPLIVGGSCSQGPTELVTAWVESNTISDTIEYTTLHVDTIGLNHSSTPPVRTLTRTGGTFFDPSNLVNPFAVFTLHWPMTLTRFADGRIFVGLSTSVPETVNMSVDVYELQPGFTERTLYTTDAVPASALQLDFSSPSSSVDTFMLGGGRWTHNGDAAYFTLGCAAE